jgi:hypothetical protein
MTNHTAYHTDSTSTVALAPGAILTDFRGEEWVFEQITRPKTEGRSAKVEVSQDGHTREFYAEVFPGLEVI